MKETNKKLYAEPNLQSGLTDGLKISNKDDLRIDFQKNIVQNLAKVPKNTQVEMIKSEYVNYTEEIEADTIEIMDATQNNKQKFDIENVESENISIDADEIEITPTPERTVLSNRGELEYLPSQDMRLMK